MCTRAAAITPLFMLTPSQYTTATSLPCEKFDSYQDLQCSSQKQKFWPQHIPALRFRRIN
jgi:hypothetical protein